MPATSSNKETELTSTQSEDNSTTQQGKNVSNQNNIPNNEIDKFKSAFNQFTNNLSDTYIKTNTDNLKKLEFTLTQLKKDYDEICGNQKQQNQNQEDLSEYSEKLKKMSELISILQDRRTVVKKLKALSLSKEKTSK